MNQQPNIHPLFNAPKGWKAPDYAAAFLALALVYILCHAAGVI